MDGAEQVDVLITGCGPAGASAAMAAHDAGASVLVVEETRRGAGSVWGSFTHSGGGLTDALVFGRLAGQQAARSRAGA